jgi:hypothetical protein
MKWKFENFKKGPLMTIVGIALLGSAIYIYKVVPDSELFATAVLLLGAGAIGLKDPRKPGGAAGAGLIALLILSSCVTYKKCQEKFADSRPSKVTVVDSFDLDVPVPPDSLEGDINLDTLCDEWRQIQADVNDTLKTVYDSMSAVSESGKLTTKLWIDKYKRLLRFKSKVVHDTVHVHHYNTVTVDCPPQNVFDCDKGRSGIGKLWDGVRNPVVLALLVIIAFLLTLLKFRRR